MDINPLAILSVATLFAYTIPACYFDLKYRELPAGFWWVLLVICVPATAILYWYGIYPWYLLLLSGGMTALYAALCILGFYQGADFQFLAFISFFLVQSPRTGNVLMPVPFGIFLIASIIGCAGAYTMYPPVREWLMEYNATKVPFILPISLALWLTVMFA